jgi:hypothetical protein
MAMYDKIVSFLPSQIDTPQSTNAFTTAYTYVLGCGALLPKLRLYARIVLPMTPFGSGTLDEFYPSAPNLWAMLIHTILVCIQVELAFVLSVPFFVFFVGAGCAELP